MPLRQTQLYFRGALPFSCHPGNDLKEQSIKYAFDFHYYVSYVRFIVFLRMILTGNPQADLPPHEILLNTPYSYSKRLLVAGQPEAIGTIEGAVVTGTMAAAKGHPAVFRSGIPTSTAYHPFFSGWWSLWDNGWTI